MGLDTEEGRGDAEAMPEPEVQEREVEPGRRWLSPEALAILKRTLSARVGKWSSINFQAEVALEGFCRRHPDFKFVGAIKGDEGE